MRKFSKTVRCEGEAFKGMSFVRVERVWKVNSELGDRVLSIGIRVISGI